MNFTRSSQNMKWIKKIWAWLFGRKAVAPSAPPPEAIPHIPDVEKDKIVSERQKKTTLKSTRKKDYRPSGYTPPRSMTEREKELYAIKPELQYWVNQGEL